MQPQFPPSGAAPVYPEQYLSWPQQAEQTAWPAQAPAPAPPQQQPRRSTASLVLGISLVFTLIALVISIVAGIQKHGTVVEERDALQATVDKHEATETDQRKKFTDADLAGRYRKVLDADEKLETAFQRWLDTADGSAEERQAGDAWEAARKSCMQAVTDYEKAARPYPSEWFTTPSVVDLTKADTDCWYRN